MLSINTGRGGIITNNFITDPNDGDLLAYNVDADMWENFKAAYLTGVNVDDTLTGNGASIPLHVVDPFLGVAHDDTMVGDGKNSLLSVLDPFNGVSHDTTLDGDGKDTPLSVVDPYTGVQHDATLSGDGKNTDLSVVDPYTGVLHDTTLTGDGKTVALSVLPGNTTIAVSNNFTGNGSITTPLELSNSGTASVPFYGGYSVDAKGRLTGNFTMSARFDAMWKQAQTIPNNVSTQASANNLQSNYNNRVAPNQAPFNGSTGTYTAKIAGTYLATISADFAANGTGVRKVALSYSNGTVTEIASNTSNIVGGSFVTTVNMSHVFFMNVNDNCAVGCFQTSGGNLGATIYCSIVFLHN